MSTIHTTINDLARLVTPVLPLSSITVPRPWMGTIRVRATGTHLYADTTDNYVAGVSRIASPQDDKFDELLRASDLRMVLRVVKAARGHDVPLVIRSVAEHIVFDTAASKDLEAATFRFKDLGGTQGPDIWGLLQGALTQQGGSALAGINPNNFSLFAAATKRNVNPHGLPLIVRNPSTSTKPVIVACGDHFLGALMPVRTVEETNQTILDTWRTILTPQDPAAVTQ